MWSSHTTHLPCTLRLFGPKQKWQAWQTLNSQKLHHLYHFSNMRVTGSCNMRAQGHTHTKRKSTTAFHWQPKQKSFERTRHSLVRIRIVLSRRQEDRMDSSGSRKVAVAGFYQYPMQEYYTGKTRSFLRYMEWIARWRFRSNYCTEIKYRADY